MTSELTWVSLGLLLLFGACKRNDIMDSARNLLEIVPGKSIGPLRLGAEKHDIPATAKVDGDRGEFEGVHFSLGADQRIADIWIEDLRVVPRKLVVGNRELPVRAPLEEIKQFFGGCAVVNGIKGGRFYNCSTGVALGCPYDGSDTFIQLRIKHR